MHPQRLKPPGWARHGSARYLWTHEQVASAIHYVLCEQGDAMEVYEEPALCRSRFCAVSRFVRKGSQSSVNNASASASPTMR